MNAQREGLKDFFDFNKSDDLIFSLTKVVTKNMLHPTNAEGCLFTLQSFNTNATTCIVQFQMPFQL